MKEILQRVILSEALQPRYRKGENKDNSVLQCREGISPHCTCMDTCDLILPGARLPSITVQDIFMEIIESLPDH